MKIDITNFLPWAEYLQEYSQNHNTDLTTAAFDIVKNLRAYKQFEVLQNAIEKAQRNIHSAEQQLAMLNMSTARQQKPIATLIDLQAAGFWESQIAELTKLVNIWNKLPGIDTGFIFGQGNGGGSERMSKLDDELIKH
jgi:iron-sulfur cluster repair protein YtfE (RIC family)